MPGRPLRQLGEQHLRLAREVVHRHGQVVGGDGPLGVAPAGRRGGRPGPTSAASRRSAVLARRTGSAGSLPRRSPGGRARRAAPRAARGCEPPRAERSARSGRRPPPGGGPARALRHEQAAEGDGEHRDDQSQRVDGVIRPDPAPRRTAARRGRTRTPPRARSTPSRPAARLGGRRLQTIRLRETTRNPPSAVTGRRHHRRFRRIWQGDVQSATVPPTRLCVISRTSSN